VAALFDMVRTLNKFADDQKLESGSAAPEQVETLHAGTAVLRELSATLGLFQKPVESSGAGDDALVGQLMSLLIELRASARKNKDFATADKIRQGLAQAGVVLEDRATGTEWSRAK